MPGFDQKAFMEARFTPRQADVSLPDLGRASGTGDPGGAGWLFSDGPPVFTVRGLTAHEISHAQDAGVLDAAQNSILDALEKSAGSSVGAQIRELFDAAGRPHRKTLIHIAQVSIGLVNPPGDKLLAAKLAKHFPIEFLELVKAIDALTGQGSEAIKKPQPSGLMTESS